MDGWRREREGQRQREPLGDARCLMKGELVKKQKCKCSVAKKKTQVGFVEFSGGGTTTQDQFLL